MSHQGGGYRRRPVAWGLSQRLVMMGFGLKVVGSIEKDPDLMAVAVPIHVVGAPVKGVSVDGTIPLN